MINIFLSWHTVVTFLAFLEQYDIMTVEREEHLPGHGILYDEATRIEGNASAAAHEAREAVHDLEKKLTLSWTHVEHKGNPCVYLQEHHSEEA